MQALHLASFLIISICMISFALCPDSFFYFLCLTSRFLLLASCFSLLASRFLLLASRFSLLASRWLQPRGDLPLTWQVGTFRHRRFSNRKWNRSTLEELGGLAICSQFSIWGQFLVIWLLLIETLCLLESCDVVGHCDYLKSSTWP